MFLNNIKYNNERLYIGRCNHARRLRLHLGDDEDDTSHLQKGHKPRKRLQDVFEKWVRLRKRRQDTTCDRRLLCL